MITKKTKITFIKSTSFAFSIKPNAIYYLIGRHLYAI